MTHAGAPRAVTTRAARGRLRLVLLLDEPAPELARRFDSGEALEPPLADHPIFTRWARAMRLGSQRESDGYPQGTTRSDLAVRRDRLDDVFREERALIEPITGQLAARSLIAIVADPDGVVLASHGGAALDDPAARVRLVEGALWSEEARGTNAIGTAIVERRSVAVIGAAHFERRNRALFCYAKPILDARGDVVAVLDVTGPMSHHDPAVGLAVEAAGASLERALRALAYAHAGGAARAAIERLVERSSAAALLVEASGVVRVASAAARAALGLCEGMSLGDRRAFGRAEGEITCERVFGVPFAMLAALATGGTGRMRFETAKAAHDVDLDPIAGADGRAIAVVVHLHPHGAARRARAITPARAPSPPPHPAFDAILARDADVIAAKEAATRIARTTLPVLFLAETGTGKELFAHAVHAASPRAAGPFVALNCGALASGVLESELFGYAPGAFTGALRGGSRGKIGAADGGTLFLDEIGEMPDALQAALLRVLDDGVYHRVGDARPSRADFRLVCATCTDLPERVARGAFRRDLFFRIHGACIVLPPLRARTDRIFVARGLLEALGAGADAELGEDAEAWIEAHDWPGNVRELKSALAYARAMAGGGRLTRDDFPRTLVRAEPHFEQIVGTGAGPGASARPEPRPRTRDAILHGAVDDAMRACHGNVTEAARRLGVARSTIYRAIRESRRAHEA